MKGKLLISLIALAALLISLSACIPTNRIAVNAQGQIVLALQPDGTFDLLPKEDQDLYMFDAASGSLRRLTDDRSSKGLPQWSPDGKRLLYVTWPSGSGDGGDGQVPRSVLWVYDPSRDQATPLLEREGTIWNPQFSPSGREIAFRLAAEAKADADAGGNRDGNGNGNESGGRETVSLEIVDASSGESRYTREGFVLAHRWRPDGSLVVIEAREITRSGETVRSILADVLLLDPRRGENAEVLLLQFLLPEGWAVWSPYWEWLFWDLSPDGQTLLLTLVDSPIAFPQGDASPTVLYSARIQGERIAEVTKLAENAAYPAFSPSGRRIAYVRPRPRPDAEGESENGGSQGADVFVLDREGDRLRRVTPRPGEYLYPFWVDETRLGFLESQEQGAYTIWIADLFDGSLVNLSERLRERL